MKKLELMNKVMVSDLRPEDKCLLVELLLRSDEDGYSFPSVERLCKVRGIKHAKNFKGADHYLPGLVTKVRKGRRNGYTIDMPAVEGLFEASVVTYRGSWRERQGNDAPSAEGLQTPVTADLAPVEEEEDPGGEGVDTTQDNTSVSTRESTRTVATADAVPTEVGGLPPSPLKCKGEARQTPPPLNGLDSPPDPGAAREGVRKRYAHYVQGVGYDSPAEAREAKQRLKERLLGGTA